MARPFDETYIIDLCDGILGQRAFRGHRFDCLRGDGRNGRPGVRLPVDAFYKDLSLVIEYHERQHSSAVKHFDRRMTVSGVSRSEQRKMYDERRKIVLPQHGIKLVILDYREFQCTPAGRLKRTDADQHVVAVRLAPFAHRS